MIPLTKHRLLFDQDNDSPLGGLENKRSRIEVCWCYCKVNQWMSMSSRTRTNPSRFCLRLFENDLTTLCLQLVQNINEQHENWELSEKIRQIAAKIRVGVSSQVEYPNPFLPSISGWKSPCRFCVEKNGLAPNMGGKSLTNSSMLFPLQPIYTGIAHDSPVLLWMEGILHHQKDGWNMLKPYK